MLLASPGLSYGMPDLHCHMWALSGGIQDLAPRAGIEPGPPRLGAHGVLATGSRGKSPWQALEGAPSSASPGPATTKQELEPKEDERKGSALGAQGMGEDRLLGKQGPRLPVRLRAGVGESSGDGKEVGGMRRGPSGVPCGPKPRPLVCLLHPGLKAWSQEGLLKEAA